MSILDIIEIINRPKLFRVTDWKWVEIMYGYFIPVLQLILVYPGIHSPGGHSPVFGLHGWDMQWQVWAHSFPNFPESHATNRHNIQCLCNGILSVQ